MAPCQGNPCWTCRCNIQLLLLFMRANSSGRSIGLTDRELGGCRTHQRPLEESAKTFLMFLALMPPLAQLLSTRPALVTTRCRAQQMPPLRQPLTACHPRQTTEYYQLRTLHWYIFVRRVHLESSVVGRCLSGKCSMNMSGGNVSI